MCSPTIFYCFPPYLPGFIEAGLHCVSYATSKLLAHLANYWKVKNLFFTCLRFTQDSS